MTEQQNAIGATLRRRLAMKAFGHTAAYDAMIADWLAREQGERFPDRLVLAGRKRQELRYGENPHQAAAAYASGNARPGVIGAEQPQGKALRYNKLNKTNDALELTAELAAHTAANTHDATGHMEGRGRGV